MKNESVFVTVDKFLKNVYLKISFMKWNTTQ